MMYILLTKQAQDNLDAIEKKHGDKILAKLQKMKEVPRYNKVKVQQKMIIVLMENNR